MVERIRKKKIKKPDAIFSADWHIRNDQPAARKDNIFDTINKKINEISSLAEDIPLIISGDVGHKPQLPCKLLEWFIDKVKSSNVKIFAIPGQHDLPSHSLELWKESAIGVLHAAGAIQLLGLKGLPSYWEFDKFAIHAFPYGKDIESITNKNDVLRNIAIIHQLVLEKIEQGWEEDKGIEGSSLLSKFKCFDGILSGDNHISFLIEKDNRFLVNAGSILRTTAAQINHKPCVWKYYADTNTVEPHYLTIEQDVISREHIEVQEEKDKRMQAFVESVKSGGEIKLSFEDNMVDYLKMNPVDERIEKKLWEIVEN